MALNLQKFYIDNNFKIEKDFAYGIYKDRTTSVVEKGSYVKINIGFSKPLERENGMQISRKMSELKAKHRVLQHALTTNVSLELILYKSADINAEFYPVLNEAIQILDEFHPANIEVCAICGQVMPSNSPFARIKDTVIQAHDACIEQLIVASNKMGKDLLIKFNKKAFLKTFFSGLLVLISIIALISLVSYFGGFGFISILSGWLFFIIFRIVLQKLKQPIRKQELNLSLIFTILASILSIYLGSLISISVSNDQGFIETFKYYFVIVSENFETLGRPLILYLVLSLILSCPTIIIGMKQISSKINAIKRL